MLLRTPSGGEAEGWWGWRRITLFCEAALPQTSGSLLQRSERKHLCCRSQLSLEIQWVFGLLSLDEDLTAASGKCISQAWRATRIGPSATRCQGLRDQLWDIGCWGTHRETIKGSSWEAGVFIRVKVKVSWSLKRFSVHGSQSLQTHNLFPRERRSSLREQIGTVRLAPRKTTVCHHLWVEGNNLILWTKLLFWEQKNFD